MWHLSKLDSSIEKKKKKYHVITEGNFFFFDTQTFSQNFIFNYEWS